MDCRKVILEIANHFADGYSREGISYLRKPLDSFKKELREKYFNEVRKDEGKIKSGFMPRTGHFISAVYAEIFDDLKNDRDLGESLANGFADRALNNLRKIGYGNFIDGNS
ncbi:MAG: hypothetical protein Q7S27_01755 [Nanoarchaeota archaeon]|nr:hypothetical protein [Nanoarchaeota archaeon]